VNRDVSFVVIDGHVSEADENCLASVTFICLGHVMDQTTADIGKERGFAF
jgi:hypothetical protein